MSNLQARFDDNVDDVPHTADGMFARFFDVPPYTTDGEVFLSARNPRL